MYYYFFTTLEKISKYLIIEFRDYISFSKNNFFKVLKKYIWNAFNIGI